MLMIGFFGCTALREVRVPDCDESISIGYQAFEGCNIDKFRSIAADRNDSWRMTQDVLMLDNQTVHPFLPNCNVVGCNCGCRGSFPCPFDPRWNQEEWNRQKLAASHRAVPLSERTRKAIKRRNDFYRWLLSEYPGLEHLRGYPLLETPEPVELPSELARRVGPVQRHLNGHMLQCHTQNGVVRIAFP